MANIGNITVSPSEIVFTQSEYQSKAERITFTTEGIIPQSVTVKSDSDWIEDLEIINYTGTTVSSSGKIYFSVKQNTETTTRKANVTILGISASNGRQVNKNVVVSQQGSSSVNSSLVIFSSAYSSTYKEQYVVIPYSAINISNIEFQIDEGGEWCEPKFSNNIINVLVKENTRQTQRTAYFTIMGRSSITNEIVDMYDVNLIQSPNSGYIEFTPTSVTKDYHSTEGTITCIWDNVRITGSSITEGSSNWLTLTLPSSQPTRPSGSFTSTYKMVENSTNERSAIFTVSGTSTVNGSTVIKQFLFKQMGSPNKVEFPIWKDTYIDIDNTSSYVDYSLMIDGEVVYKGRAYGDGTKVSIKVNDIMADYINDRMDFTKVLNDNGTYIEANLYIDGSEECILRAYNDWSYETTVEDSLANSAIVTLSRPIRKEVDVNQYLLYTVFSPHGKPSNSMVTYADSTTIYNFPIQGKIETEIIPMVDYPNASVISVNTATAEDDFKVVCGNKYCLYYLNKYGGWDSILLKGNATKKCSFSRDSFKQKILNYTVNRNTVHYLNKITESWKLNTDYLTDSQSELFADAMASNKMYLHLLEKGELVPVIVTDSSIDYKTFKNQGRKFAQYTINVQSAKDKKIR